MKLWRVIVLWMLLALPAAAQDVQPQVLIVDIERVYIETLLGRRIEADFSAQAAALQAENDRIASTLIAEETSLTERRPEMTPELFRKEADTFHERAQAVRQSREDAEVALRTAFANARARFEDQIQGVIANIMIERGAVMVMERRSVFLSVRAANITDDVIVRVDAELGDGSR